MLSPLSDLDLQRRVDEMVERTLEGFVGEPRPAGDAPMQERLDYLERRVEVTGRFYNRHLHTMHSHPTFFAQASRTLWGRLRWLVTGRLYRRLSRAEEDRLIREQGGNP